MPSKKALKAPVQDLWVGETTLPIEEEITCSIDEEDGLGEFWQSMIDVFEEFRAKKEDPIGEFWQSMIDVFEEFRAKKLTS